MCSQHPSSILIGAAIVALWAGSAAGRATAKEILRLSNSDSGSQVEVSVGSEIVVTLQTIGFGQYGTPSVSSPALQFLGVAAGPPNPGGPVQQYRFLARSAGRAHMSIPFTGGVGPNASTPAFNLKLLLN